jgi:hypothetical protein
LAGVYRGLFGESPVVRCESSGAISLTLGNAGTFSGALRNAGLTRSFTGRFDAAGRARVAVNSSGGNAWALEFALAFDGSFNGLTGTVRRAGWTAPLLAERTVFNARSNPAPFAPRHTFLVTGLTDPALAGAGDGYGTVTTTRGGSATMAGRLADNATIALSSPLLRDGWWPLYHPLYAGKGCLLGWMQFRSDAPAGFGGQVNWIRPAISNATWYRGGFTNISDITGLAYVAPASRADRVLSLEAGQAVFNGGSLSAAFTNLFSLSASGVATNLSTNKMMLTIQPANGIFTGTVKPPGSSTAVSFKGAVLQGFNWGGGILPGTRGSGRVTIGARP